MNLIDLTILYSFIVFIVTYYIQVHVVINKLLTFKYYKNKENLIVDLLPAVITLPIVICMNLFDVVSYRFTMLFRALYNSWESKSEPEVIENEIF